MAGSPAACRSARRCARCSPSVHPEGVITQLSTRWDGPIDAPAHYRVKGAAERPVAQRARGERHDAVGRPGLRNATVQLDASEAGGEARIGLRAGRGRAARRVRRAGAAVRPARRQAGLEDRAARRRRCRTSRCGCARRRFANADAEGELSATWRTGAGDGMARGGRYPGQLELDGRIGSARAARTVRYLPLGLPDSVRSYVGRAVLGRHDRARPRSGSAATSGTSRSTAASRAASGEFRIDAKVDDLAFAYIPGEAPHARARPSGTAWPPLTAVSGELDRRPHAGSRSATPGRASAAPTGPQIHGAIPQLGDHARLRRSTATARGPLAEMLRYVNATPIGRWTGACARAPPAARHGRSQARARDPARRPRARPGVKGSLALGGNDVRMTPDTPLLGAAKARIDFTQSAFTVAAGSARALGGDMSFEGGSQGDARSASAARARPPPRRCATPPSSAGSRACRCSGQARLSRDARVRRRPAAGRRDEQPRRPRRRPAASARRKAAPATLRAAHPDRARRRRARRSARARSAAGRRSAAPCRRGSCARLGRRGARGPRCDPADACRGADARRAAASRLRPARRRRDRGRRPQESLNVDEWEAVADRLLHEPARGDAAPPGRSTPAAARAMFPTTIGLRVGELTTGSRRLGNVTAGLSREGEPVAGQRRCRRARRLHRVPAGAARRRTGRAGRGTVYARLARLSLPKGEAERVESLLDEQPASVPALDIVVDDFELRGKRLGRLEIEAANRSSGGRDAVREWRLSKLNLVMPEAQLSGDRHLGRRRGTGRARRRSRAAMDFTLDARRQRRPARAPRHGQGRARRQGLARRRACRGPARRSRPTTAKMTGADQGRDRCRPVPEGRARARRACSACSACSRCRGACCSTSATCSRRASRSTTSPATCSIGARRGHAPTTCACAAPAAAVLMEGERRHRARDAEPARRRRPEINAGTASLAYRGHQSGDRPRHLPGAVLPEQAADRRGEHARVPRHRAVGRSEGRAGRAQHVRRIAGAASTRPPQRAAPTTPTTRAERGAR